MSKGTLGVVIVTFNAADVIAGCLESLCAAGPDLRIVVVDNASDDDTVATIRAWAAGTQPFAPPADLPFAIAPVIKPVTLAEGGPGIAPDPHARVTLVQSGANRGFAGGVNTGLACLARDPAVAHFWVLNPDSMVPVDSVAALQAQLAGDDGYGLMGGRVVYMDRPDTIQIDGGTVNWRTGVTGNLNLGRSHAATPPPPLEDIAFIMGASMVASRRFYDRVGPMREDYFLYYEEVDWALRRGEMPLAYCPGLVVYHWAGSAIGSPTLGRLASPFSLYFKHRGRMRFLRRFRPAALPMGALYSLGIAGRLLLRGGMHEAWAVLSASFGLSVPGSVRARLSPEAAAIAFAPATD